jgi:hypothetical protein
MCRILFRADDQDRDVVAAPTLVRCSNQQLRCLLRVMSPDDGGYLAILHPAREAIAAQ